MLRVFLFFAFNSFVWGTDVWGYQNLGVSGFIDVDQEGYLYLVGQPTYFLNDFFVTKISPHGKEIWTYTHETPVNYQPTAIGFGPDSIYISGSTSQSLITKINRHNGSFEWERRDFASLNRSNSLSIVGVAVDHKNNPYILYHPQDWWVWDKESELPYQGSQQKIVSHSSSQTSSSSPLASGTGGTNDYVVKLDGHTSETIWEINLRTNLDFTNKFPIFDVIILLNEVEFAVKGKYYLNKEIYQMNTMSCETGAFLSDTYLKTPYETKDPNRAVYKQDHYYFRTTNRHEYGKVSYSLGSVINKNWCDDGHHLVPDTSTTSISEMCPGLSWSLKDPYGRQLECTYYYGRCGPGAIILIFLLPIVLILSFSYIQKIATVHIVSSLLSSLVFSSSLAYLFGVVFYDLLLFVLAIAFLFLPSLHLLQYLYQAGKHRKIRLLFHPPGPMTPLFVLSSREGGVPYFRDFRCLPMSVQPSEDFMLLLGGWLLAGLANLIYGIFWIIFHLVPLLPWIIVHGPWYLLVYICGYVFYRLGLLQHHTIKERWLIFFFHEESLEDSQQHSNDIESTDAGEDVRPTLKLTDLSGELIISSISVLLFGLIGELIVQTFNNQRMHDTGFLPIICVIFKCLFLLNIINRIVILYGSMAIPHLRSLIFSLFPNYVAQAPFSELQSEENQNDSTELLNQIQELQLEVQSLRSKLAKYENVDNEEDVPDSDRDGRYVHDSRERNGERFNHSLRHHSQGVVIHHENGSRYIIEEEGEEEGEGEVKEVEKEEKKENHEDKREETKKNDISVRDDLKQGQEQDQEQKEEKENSKDDEIDVILNPIQNQVATATATATHEDKRNDETNELKQQQEQQSQSKSKSQEPPTQQSQVKEDVAEYTSIELGERKDGEIEDY